MKNMPNLDYKMLKTAEVNNNVTGEDVRKLFAILYKMDAFFEKQGKDVLQGEITGIIHKLNEIGIIETSR